MDEQEVLQKRIKEQKTVTLMIQLYCRKNHKEAFKAYKSKGGLIPEKDFLCDECRDLAEYAKQRSQHCPYIAKGTKTFCSSCKTHCYKPEYREKIRKVMRYSGPRMIFFMPGLCIKHVIDNFKHQEKNKK